MHPVVQELQPKLKEILYDCAVELKATKAALYLNDGEGRFGLVTQYGFRSGLAESVDKDHLLIDRCARGRTPFFINGLTVEPRFSKMLSEAATERLLAAPVYLRGQLVGMIDMRDKSAKALFDQADLPKAQGIADRIAELFANKSAVKPLAESPVAPPPVAQPPVAPPPPPPTPAPAPEPAPKPQMPQLATLILDARSAAERIAARPQPEMLSEAEVLAARDALRSMLLVPNVTVASFSAFGHLGGIQEVAARGKITKEGMTLLQSKLNAWLTKRGARVAPLRTTAHQPFGSGDAVGPAQMQKVFTAPVAVGSLRGLYLTVAFDADPDRNSHDMMAAFHAHLQLAVGHSMQRAMLQAVRWRAAEHLLEPDFARYAELRRHSDAVVARVEALARFIALPPPEIETVRLTALVHDSGMRLLDYERLYRKRELTSEEIAIVQEHVHVGAALVEPLLGAEIAHAVLCHHERWDGEGYPNKLQGEQIPRASRIVQICDAYETMISASSYQPPESPEWALSILARGAGAQFDPELAQRFAEMINGAR